MTSLALTYERVPAVPRFVEVFGRRRTDWRSDSAQTLRVTETSISPSWEDEVQKRLRHLLRLPKGWDGYHSEPISPSIAQFATNVLNSTMKHETPPPAIVPIAGGGLQMEWHEGGLDIELTIVRPFQGELFVHFHDGNPPIEEEIASDFTRLSSILRQIA